MNAEQFTRAKEIEKRLAILINRMAYLRNGASDMALIEFTGRDPLPQAAVAFKAACVADLEMESAALRSEMAAL